MTLHFDVRPRFDGIRQAWLAVETAWHRRSQRRELLTLDDRVLEDMGISRYDAWQEAAKGWRQETTAPVEPPKH